jgi:transmembrane sensor
MREIMPRRETSDEIDERAAQWAARVDNAPLDPAGEAELQAWLAGDARRLGAYARARAILVRVEVARALGAGYDPDRFLAVDGSGDCGDGGQDDSHAGEDVVGENPGISRRRMLWLSGTAAAVAAVAGGTIGFDRLSRGRYYETGVGEMRRIAMPDGSIVNLNTASALYVRFDSARRAVFLDAGEAQFEVTKDPARPFVVTAGSTSVQAIGTAFSVRREPDAKVSVVVSEGVVEVARAGNGTKPVTLARNMRAHADAHADTPIDADTVDPELVQRQLYWREGKIAFTDATLADAAAEFARYNAERIVIPDPALAAKRISGLFVATDPAGFADAVGAIFGVDIRRDGTAITITAA